VHMPNKRTDLIDQREANWKNEGARQQTTSILTQVQAYPPFLTRKEAC
jgi:hypothetical protein